MLRFSATHEWARLDGDLVTVGITPYAIEHLGDIVYLELPQAGASARAGEPFGEIESVKAASELFAPVDGVIAAVHSALADALDTLQKDPLGEGWMIRIRPDRPDPLAGLMTEAEYQAYLKTL